MTSWVRLDLASQPEANLVALVMSEITDQAREAERQVRLAELSGDLNRAETVDDVVGCLAGASALLDGASFVNVAMVDPEARCLRVSSPRGLDRPVESRWAVMPIDGVALTPFHHALESRDAVFVVDLGDLRDRYPHLVDHPGMAGLEATAAVPLVDRSGEVFGLLGMGWSRPFAPDPAGRARLDLLVDLCSQTLQRIRRTDAVTHLVGTLQAELLSGQDDPDGIEVAVGYRPAVSDLGFGGDWYDVVATSEDATAFVVGDVVGHGIEAAARMAQTKSVVRALTLNADDLAEVFPQATRSLAHLDEAYVATAVIVSVDRATGTLCWVTAGHLPPLLRRPDGSTELLWGPRQPPIGMEHEDHETPTLLIEPGSMLVLYTDGLVEERGTLLDDRLRDLVDVVAGLPLDVDAVTARDAILAELAGESSEDDVAIIVARIS